MGHQKNVPLSAVTRHQEPRIRALIAFTGTCSRLLGLQDSTAPGRIRIQESRLQSCDISIPSSTLISLSGSINCSLHLAQNPNYATCPAANPLGSTSISIYTPWTLHLSYSLTSPYLIHPFSSFFFSPSSQSSKQHRQDVWPSSRLHRLCRQNPRWFFLGVRNRAALWPRTTFMLKPNPALCPACLPPSLVLPLSRVCLLSPWLLLVSRSNSLVGAVERSGVKPEDVEEVFFGNVLSAK